MAPITASQFGTNRFMERFLSGSSDQPLSSAQRFSCAAVSGGVSAFIGSPSEMIIIQQQVNTCTTCTSVMHAGFVQMYSHMCVCCIQSHVRLSMANLHTPQPHIRDAQGADHAGLAPHLLNALLLQKSGRSLLAELRNFFGTYQAHSIYRGLVSATGATI